MLMTLCGLRGGLLWEKEHRNRFSSQKEIQKTVKDAEPGEILMRADQRNAARCGNNRNRQREQKRDGGSYPELPDVFYIELRLYVGYFHSDDCYGAVAQICDCQKNRPDPPLLY